MSMKSLPAADLGMNQQAEAFVGLALRPFARRRLEWPGRPRGGRRPPPRPRRCRATGKLRWPDHLSAIRVTHSAARSRVAAAERGVPSRRREARTYQCDACQGWHTTSRPR